jgi:large repetitive protein
MNVPNFSFTFSGVAGLTTGVFNVSDELVTRAENASVLGSCVPQVGTSGPVADCALFNSGGTTITIVYRAIIRDDYAVTFQSGDQSVDEGDVLVNTVVINGDLLDVQSLAPTGSSENDNSAAEVAIQQGTLTKSIYAINGNTTLPNPLQIGPGDTVTYRLTLTLPTSDIGPLQIDDFLPLPIFDATTVTTFNNAAANAAVPASGVAKFGPSDTFFAESGITPVKSTSATGNSVTWEYAEFDSPTAPSTVIDILFTITASDDPFADGLYLTNQANAVQDTRRSWKRRRATRSCRSS